MHTQQIISYHYQYYTRCGEWQKLMYIRLFAKGKTLVIPDQEGFKIRLPLCGTG